MVSKDRIFTGMRLFPRIPCLIEGIVRFNIHEGVMGEFVVDSTMRDLLPTELVPRREEDRRLPPYIEEVF